MKVLIIFLSKGCLKVYPKRIVNSIYFDTEIFQDVWDNINGFGDRKKIRVRWYNEIKNSKVKIEEKKKKRLHNTKTVSKSRKI